RPFMAPAARRERPGGSFYLAGCRWRVDAGGGQTHGFRRSFEKHILVLHVADDKRPLAVAILHHKLESADAGIDGNHRRRPVIILGRGARAPPLAEIKYPRPALRAYIDRPERIVPVMFRQLLDSGRVRRNDQTLPLLGDVSLASLCS